MTNRIRGLAVGVALVAVAATAPGAAAAPVSVNLRVEGAAKTIFDGPVTTDGHSITTPSGNGPHPCDGTNGGAHPAAVPVATAALDDGARANAFSWDATWDASFQDFLVTQVGGESATSTQFWGYYVNFQSPSVGGCQMKVNTGDEVLFAFDAFSKSHVLKLSGPGAATTGAPVTVQVVDAQDGSPQSGVSVNGTPTGADGNATLSFAQAGIYRLKGDRADSIRSNAITLCVDPPGADPCTSGDRSAPSLDVRLPGRRLASERGRSRTVLVAWQADDAAGAGVSHYAVDVREVARGAGAGGRRAGAGKVAPGEWRSIVERTALTGVHFRGDSGTAYQFRVTAVDRATNRASVETDPLVLPVDDRDRGLWRFSRGWRRLRRNAAWGRTVMRAERAGASATLRFSGRRVALVGRELRRGGRVRVSVEGRSRVLRLRGRPRDRSVLWTSRRLGDGPHVLRVRYLGGGPVDLDAVAPLP
jgi:hypothetical protein